VLAELARGRTRRKIPDLRLACAGRFGAQHALMCTLHLEHLDHLTDMIARLDTRIDEASLPFVPQTTSLATIPGISERAAQVIISESGRRGALLLRNNPWVRCRLWISPLAWIRGYVLVRVVLSFPTELQSL
jgi:transposase